MYCAASFCIVDAGTTFEDDPPFPLLEPPLFEPPPFEDPDEPPELVPELEPVPDEPVLAPLLPLVLACDAGFVTFVWFPTPFPVLSFPFILDKFENTGLSLFVIPYAATAAAIHNTMIIEIITFDFSNFSPPSQKLFNILVNLFFVHL